MEVESFPMSQVGVRSRHRLPFAELRESDVYHIPESFLRPLVLVVRAP